MTYHIINIIYHNLYQTCNISTYNIKMITFKLDDLIWQHRTTAEDIYQKTGIGKSTLSTIRNNKNINISIHTLDKLCKYFDCKISDLIEYIPD